MIGIHKHITPVESVNRLPLEILAHIFHLLSANPCHKPPFDGNPPVKYLRYPDCPANVCSYWRQAAVSSPALWTHIDLSPHLSNRDGYINYARNHSRNAGDVPLNVHLDDQGCTSDDAHVMDDLVESLGPRMGSLDFIITTHNFLQFHRHMFEFMFPDLSPKIFKALRVDCKVSFRDPLIGGWDVDPITRVINIMYGPDHYNLRPNILSQKEEIISNCLTGVTSLHLRGTFFEWSNMLYHGLVDLRLTSSPAGATPSIPKSALKSILSNSPGLRILHFSLGITLENVANHGSLHNDPESGGPVYLPELEVVQVDSGGIYYGREERRMETSTGRLLRLLAPGSKPLRLTLEGPSFDQFFKPRVVKDFFSRSQVEKLCVKGGRPSMDDLLLCHLPNLKVLVFDSCARLEEIHSGINSAGNISCLIRAARIQLNDLSSIAELCPEGLVLCKVEVRDRGREMTGVELRKSFPTVQFINDISLWSHPVEDWGVVDGYTPIFC